MLDFIVGEMCACRSSDTHIHIFIFIFIFIYICIHIHIHIRIHGNGSSTFLPLHRFQPRFVRLKQHCNCNCNCTCNGTCTCTFTCNCNSNCYPVKDVKGCNHFLSLFKLEPVAFLKHTNICLCIPFSDFSQKKTRLTKHYILDIYSVYKYYRCKYRNVSKNSSWPHHMISLTDPALNCSLHIEKYFCSLSLSLSLSEVRIRSSKPPPLIFHFDKIFFVFSKILDQYFNYKCYENV